MIYIIIVVLVLILLFLVLNALYKNTNYYQNPIQQTKKMKNVPNDLEIINLGSSYAKYAFDYRDTHIAGFNFGMQPQSLSYDFKILKQYTSHLKKDCIVLITLPDLVFGFLDYNYDSANIKYYYFLNNKYINNYTKLKHFLRLKFPIIYAKKQIKFILKDIKKDLTYDQDAQLLNVEEVKKQAILRVDGWTKQFTLKDTINCDLSDDLKNMFNQTTKLVREMIDYCIKNGFKPALVVPPVTDILNSLMSKKFMNSVLYENIKLSNTQNIPVLDYLYDIRFQDYKLYVNADMLNKTGREQFTKTVINDLKDIGYIKSEEV